jgi:hypothetical protein
LNDLIEFLCLRKHHWLLAINHLSSH